MRLLFLLLMLYATAYSQTAIDLTRQGKFQVGPILPATCNVGQMFLATGVKSTSKFSSICDNSSNSPASSSGGPVINPPSLHLIFWGSFWSTVVAQRNTLISSAQSMISSVYLSGLSQYGITSPGIYHGTTIITSSDPPLNYTFVDVQSFVTNLVNTNVLIAPNQPGGANLYIVMMPQGSIPPPGFNGEHSFTVLPSGHLWLGWVAFLPLTLQTTVLSHELVEGLTDPEPGSGWRIPVMVGSSEICDVCCSTSILSDGSTVASYWSQADSSCIVPRTASITPGQNVYACMSPNVWVQQSTSSSASTYTATFSATPTFDLSQGTNQKIIVSGTITSVFIVNVIPNFIYTFWFCQDGAGNHDVSFPSNFHGFMKVGKVANKCSFQSALAVDSNNLNATGAGVIDQ